jgi:hypothetical protein
MRARFRKKKQEKKGEHEQLPRRTFVSEPGDCGLGFAPGVALVAAPLEDLHREEEVLRGLTEGRLL